MESQVLFPVRCYGCNTVIGKHQYAYESLMKQGYSPEEAMDKLGIKKICCRSKVIRPFVLPFSANINIGDIEQRLRKQYGKEKDYLIESRFSRMSVNNQTSVDTPGSLATMRSEGKTSVASAASATMSMGEQQPTVGYGTPTGFIMPVSAPQPGPQIGENPPYPADFGSAQSSMGPVAVASQPSGVSIHGEKFPMEYPTITEQLPPNLRKKRIYLAR